MSNQVLLLGHGRNHCQCPETMNFRFRDVLLRKEDLMQNSVQVDWNTAVSPDICLDLQNELYRLPGPYQMVICVNCTANIHDVVVGNTGPRESFWQWVAASLQSGGTFWGTVSTFGLQSFIKHDASASPDVYWALTPWEHAETCAEPPSAKQKKALKKYSEMYRQEVVKITGGNLQPTPVIQIKTHLAARFQHDLPLALVFTKI